jgi:hypothetical protein
MEKNKVKERKGEMETELFMEILLRDIGAERSILVDRQNDRETARDK